MKYMSLNTHSWMEEEPMEKLRATAELIMAQEIDVIALQEVNQLKKSELAELDNQFCPLSTHEFPVRQDNYALLLVTYLKEQGYHYYWSYTCSHIGYDIYEEGSAILSKQKFRAESLLVSPMNDMNDYHTRQILLAHLDQLTVGSCHFSWWEEDVKSGFYYEWQQLLEMTRKISHQVILLGDFNSPAHASKGGYDLVTESFFDVYHLAEEKMGEHTVEMAIDGWADNTEKLRIDFGFVSQKVKVESYQVVFNDVIGPVVSDHYGVLIEM